MKKLLKAISLLLGIVFLFGMFASCKTVDPSQDEGSDAISGTVEVYYWKSGVQITFLEKLKEAFESKHKDITIDLSGASADANVFFNTIDQGASINTIDLYIGTMGAFWNRTEYLERWTTFSITRWKGRASRSAKRSRPFPIKATTTAPTPCPGRRA